VHLAYVGTASATSLYVNGTLQDTVSASIAAPMKWIGYPGDSVRGTLDDVRVYSRALSGPEIAAVANGQIYDLAGNALDGEYSGTWPSGNGTAGGDLGSTFTIASQMRVTNLSPAPNTVAPSPANVMVTFNRDLDAGTVDATTFLLTGRGPDGVFDTGDDVPITAAAITIVGTKQAQFDLTGITLDADLYRVTLSSGGIKDSGGNALDGEFSGAFPSGDNIAGGDFVATFSVGKQDQTITFPAISNKKYGDPPFALEATASSGLPVSYTVVSGPATVAGSTLTITGVGGVTVRASQAGSGYWNPAPDVERSFNVSKGTATVTLSGLTHTYDGAPMPVVVTTAPPGLATSVTYNASPTPPTEPGPSISRCETGRQSRPPEKRPTRCWLAA